MATKTKKKMDAFDACLEELRKKIKAYKGHGFKGHFHGHSKWFLDYVVAEMRMSLFTRFLDANREILKEEDDFNKALSDDGKMEAMVKRFREEGLKGRIKDACSWINCHECGQRVKIDLVDGVRLEVTNEPCPYPDGHPEIVTYLDVPSGEILLFNDFRHVYAEDRKVVFDINTTEGCRQYSEFYANLGLIMHFVGNTCPGVYQLSKECLQIGSFWNTETDEREGPGKELGSICTDLWWYSAADRDNFEKTAGKTVEQYQKEYHDRGAWPEIIRAKVKPGRYKTIGRYHMIEDGVGGAYSEISYEGPLDE